MRIPIAFYRLSNGLLVTLSEDHTAPIVAVNLWYHVGSANERPGRTGFAHLFEHMLFQGSAHVEANEHFELVQRAGGTLNGSTWLDRTNYFETLPSHQLPIALWLEADRMGYLLPAMTQQKLDTQRDVVKNERRWSVDNQPYGTWWEKLPEIVFPAEHPFQHSLIGSLEDLTAASLDDIGQFFTTFYTPDNAVLTIAGDFEPNEARHLVDEYFGSIPRGLPRPPLANLSLPSRLGGTIRRRVSDDVVVSRLFMAFRIPTFGSPGHYAASVCAAVLGTGKGSRLSHALVRGRQITSDVNVFTYDLTKSSDLLVIDALARPHVSAELLETEVTSEVDLLRYRGVSTTEVERAVSLIETEFVTTMQQAGERADRLSMFATYFGDPTLVNQEVEGYRSVTAAQVDEFARNWLGPDNRALLEYVPRDVPSDEAVGTAHSTPRVDV